MNTDDVMDLLLMAVGVALVVIGAAGVQQELPVISVDPVPGWRAYAGWVLAAGFVICLLSVGLGLRGVGGFTVLPVAAGSTIGVLLAMVVGTKLLVHEFRLSKGLVCVGRVVSIEHVPRRGVRKPYLVTTKIRKVLSGGVAPDTMAFRAQARDLEQLRVGMLLKLEYRKRRHGIDLKTWFRRKMRETLEDAIAVSVPQS